jgi:hypothetical protein
VSSFLVELEERMGILTALLQGIQGNITSGIKLIEHGIRILQTNEFSADNAATSQLVKIFWRLFLPLDSLVVEVSHFIPQPLTLNLIIHYKI